MNNKSSSSKNLVLLGVGIAAGWMMKQLFDSPQVREKRHEMMASAEELKNRLSDPDEAGRIMSIFGSSAKDVTQTYQDIKSQLIEQLGDLQLSFDEIDKTKYQTIVTDLLKDTAKAGSLPKEHVDKLKSALIDDFNKLHITKKETKSPTKKVATK